MLRIEISQKSAEFASSEKAPSHNRELYYIDRNRHKDDFMSQ